MDDPDELAPAVRSILSAARDRATQVSQATGAALRTPAKLERALDRLERGNFEIKTDIEDPDDVLDALTRRVVYGLLVAFGALSTTILFVASQFVGASLVGPLTLATVVAAGSTATVTFLLYRSMRGPKGISTSPQFTRQNLRRRRDTTTDTAAVASDVATTEDDETTDDPDVVPEPGPDSDSDPAASPGDETPPASPLEDEPADREGPTPESDDRGDQPRSAADGGVEGADDER